MAETPIVPIIDIGPYLAGNARDMDDVARQVDAACRDIGFIVIVGHGVPDATVGDIFDASGDFFALQEAEKARWSNGTGTRGFQIMGSQGLAYSLDEETPPDLFEGYSFGKIDIPDDPYHQAAATTYFEPNIWPPDPAGFQPAVTAYYCAMEDLSVSLMRIFARALDLPDSYFDGFIDKHISHLRLTHYPPQDTPPAPGQLRAGAHSDYGSLTIVCPTDAPGGLQVHGKDGAWCDVPYVPGSFIINLGDLMAVWTNDRWVSTLHRVANPPRPDASRSRLSLVFFHQPNYDAQIACIETCQSEDAPAKYVPVASGDWLMAKISKQMIDLDVSSQASE